MILWMLCVTSDLFAITSEENFYLSKFEFYASDKLNQVNLGMAEGEIFEAKTGKVYQEIVDAVLPGNGGLDIKLIRSYQKYALPNIKVPDNMGNWNFEIPEIVGTAKFSKFPWSDVCRDPMSAAEIGILNGIPLARFWTGLTLRIPGNGQKPLLFKRLDNGVIDKKSYVTTDNWKASCIPYGFLVTSPKGLRYTIDKQSFAGTSEEYSIVYSEIHVLASKIEDTNGNTINYKYIADPNRTLALKEINASDGRLVTFNFTTPQLWSAVNRTNLISSINIGGNVWTYKYHSSGELRTVERPDTSTWEYTYSGAPQDYGFGGRPVLTDITTPDLGKIKYKYITRNLKTYNPDADRLYAALSKKTITNFAGEGYVEPDFPSNPSASWDIGYETSSDALLNITKVTSSDSIVTYSYGSYKNNINKTGMLTSRLTTDLTGKHLQQVFFTYERLRQVGENYVENRPDNILYQMVTKSISITEKNFVPSDVQGINLGSNYVVSYSDFDYFGNPGTKIETSSKANVWERYLLFFRRLKWVEQNKIQTNIIYKNDLENWILGQPESIEMVGLPNNRFVRYQYTNSGKIKTISKFGLVTSFTYTPEGDMETMTDPNNNTITYSNYKRGLAQNIEQNVDGRLISTKKEINNDGTIASVTDGENNTIQYFYNGLGLQRLVKYASGSDLVTERSPGIIRKYFSDSSQMVSEEILDGFGNTVRDHKYKKLYTGSNGKTYFRPTLYDGYTPSIKHFTYDEYGRIKSESMPGNSFFNVTAPVKKYKYDAVGHMIEESLVTASETFTTRYHYRGHEIEKIGPSNNTTIYSYRLFSDPEYRQELVKLVTPENIIQTSKYNRIGQIENIKNGSYEVNYTYNKFHQLQTKTHPEIGTIIYALDDNGNVLEKQLPGQPLIKYQYNEQNKLTNKHVVSTNSLNTDYRYDKAGNLVRMSNESSIVDYKYDENNQMIQETLQVGVKTFTLGYSYDSHHNLSSITYPSGELLEYSPGAFGYPVKAGEFANRVTWYANGVLRSYDNLNGTNVSYTLNDRYRIEDIRHSKDSNILTRFTYKYDENGNVNNIYQPGSSRSLLYDKDNRLKFSKKIEGNNFDEVRFSYDAVGNISSKAMLTSKLVNASVVSTSENWTYNYEQTSNLLQDITGYKDDSRYSNIQYDNLGNIISDGIFNYTFDDYSRLSYVNSPGIVAYEYDANDKMVYKNDGQKIEVYYFYNHLGNKMLEYRPGDERLSDDSLKEYYYLQNKLVATTEMVDLNLEDSDNDGINDAYELVNGLNMNQAYLAGDDKDGDGLTDLYESQLGTSASSKDSDNDGIDDAQELSLGTSPINADSDGDGISDGMELASGRNPVFDEALLVPILSLILG